MSDEKILGTRVPETPIHRASLWLEDVKWGERRPDVDQIEQLKDEDSSYWVFIQETGLPVTPEQLKEAMRYYGENFLRMTFGNRINVVMPTPDGKATFDLAAVFSSVWYDGFQHGAATQAGKRGRSNSEIEQGIELLSE